MLNTIKRAVMPLRLSEALEIVQALYDVESQTKNWYCVPIGMLIDMCGDLPVTKVTSTHILAWQKEVDTGDRRRTPRRTKKDNRGQNNRRALPTRDNYKRAMRAFWNHLVKLGHVKRSPAEVLSFQALPPSEPKHLTDEEVDALVAAASGNVRNLALVHVLRASGMRLGGLMSMTVSNISIEQYDVPYEAMSDEESALVKQAREAGLEHVINSGYIWAYQGECQVIEKGHDGQKHIHTSFLDHDACEALLAYIKSRPVHASDSLWLNNDGEPLSESGAYQAFKAVAASAGIEAYPHQLRHTFAIRMLNEGVDPKTVAMFIGHRDFRTTLKVYMNPRKEDLAKRYRQLRNSGYNTNR